MAGTMLPLAFAPFDLFPVAVIVPALLFRSWLRATPLRAFWRGYLFGLGMFAVGASWIQISIHQFGLPVLLFSVSVTALFVAIVSLYPALLGFVANRFFKDSDRLRLLLVFPALWTLTEWLRGWLFSGFPWLNLGYSQINAGLAGLAPVLGVYGVSWAVAFTAGTLCYLFGASARTWRPYLLLLITLWVSASLSGRLSWTRPVSGPLQIALVQGNISQPLKWLPSQRVATLERYLELSRPYLGVDLIVWPETAIPAFYFEAKPFLQHLADLADKFGTEFIIGLPYRKRGAAEYFNSVISIGKQPGIYHKRHLVPFGEYLPLEPVLGPLLTFLRVPLSGFSSGDAVQPALNAARHTIGASICYEGAFGEEVIDALPKAGLLVNVSNDAWFGDSIAPHQHLEMARMRALEGGRFLLRATNTGISAVIDPKGKVIARSPQFEATALGAEIRAYGGTTPYVYMGNMAVIAPLAGALFWGLNRARGGRSSLRT